MFMDMVRRHIKKRGDNMFSVDYKIQEKPNKIPNKPKKTNNFSFNDDKIKNSLIFILIFAFAFFVIWWGFFYDDSEYGDIKHFNDKGIVFVQRTKTVSNKTSRVPYINIESEDADILNKQILEFTNKYFDYKKNIIEYTFNVSGDILSLVIRVVDNTDVFPMIYFRTYNVNLKTVKTVTKEELFALYNINEDYVEQQIKNRFQYFYNEENDQNMFHGECDYDCFLFLRGITNYLDDTYYYVENGKLYVFREFKIHSLYDEDEYFKEDDFKIKISK